MKGIYICGWPISLRRSLLNASKDRLRHHAQSPAVASGEGRRFRLRIGPGADGCERGDRSGGYRGAGQAGFREYPGASWYNIAPTKASPAPVLSIDFTVILSTI